MKRNAAFFLLMAIPFAACLAGAEETGDAPPSRHMKRALREQLEQAVKLENDVFAERVRSDDAKQAFLAFFASRKPA